QGYGAERGFVRRRCGGIPDAAAAVSFGQVPRRQRRAPAVDAGTAAAGIERDLERAGGNRSEDRELDGRGGWRPRTGGIGAGRDRSAGVRESRGDTGRCEYGD